MIRFYFHPTPNPAKVALLLEESGLTYELVPIDTSKDEQHQPCMAQPGRSSQVFPDLDSQTLKHRRVVCLKFNPPLDWRSTLDATPSRFHGAGRVEWKR